MFKQLVKQSRKKWNFSVYDLLIEKLSERDQV